ncbi:MAG: 4Fe-4S ferredoxin, partial [Betaproteobacteria bacterium]|nr:4Fe-4S ferredoxin [Betaproteobacteria bacterium]
MSDEDKPDDRPVPPGKPKPPPLSRAKRQELRRKFLRTVLLTGGIVGAGLSGFLPL